MLYRYRSYGIFHPPWAGAGLATGWAMVWDIPVGGLVARFIYGDQISGSFALAWLFFFPIIVHFLAKLHFDYTPYEDIWAERRQVRKWVWIGIVIYFLATLLVGD